MNLKELSLDDSVLLVGGSAPPLIDEGDSFTSERVRIRMLPSLVAHAYRALLPTPAGTR